MGLASRISARLPARLAPMPTHRPSMIVPAWAGAVVEEPLAIAHVGTDTFGASSYGAGIFGGVALGGPSISDTIDLMKSGDYKVSQLGKAFGDFTGTWVGKDPGGWADFSNDWLALQGRWAAAKVAAKSPALALPFADIGPAYAGLLKALDSSPIQKGDLQDLVQRIEKAGGSTNFSKMPQPKGPDLGLGILKATAPVDYLGMLTGQEVGKGPAGKEIDFLSKALAFWQEHKNEIMVVGMVVGGLMFLGVVTTAVHAAKAAAPILVKGGGVLL